MPVHAFVDETKVRDERAARSLCLEKIVADLAELDGHRLVIEQDNSLVRSDQETLFRAVRANGARVIDVSDAVAHGNVNLLFPRYLVILGFALVMCAGIARLGRSAA